MYLFLQITSTCKLRPNFSRTKDISISNRPRKRASLTNLQTKVKFATFIIRITEITASDGEEVDNPAYSGDDGIRRYRVFHFSCPISLMG